MSGFLKQLKVKNVSFDFDHRKHIHILVDSEVKDKIRELSKNLNISMLGMLECLTILLSEEDPVLIKKILSFKETQKDNSNKKSSDRNKYSSVDINTLIHMNFDDE